MMHCGGRCYWSRAIPFYYSDYVDYSHKRAGGVIGAFLFI